jgi:hypothetical protein
VAKVYRCVGRSEHTRRSCSVAVPVPRNQAIVGITEDELIVGIALRVGVSVVNESRRFTVRTDCVLSVAIEVTNERFVTDVPKDERILRSTKPAIAGTELVDDVRTLLQTAGRSTRSRMRRG